MSDDKLLDPFNYNDIKPQNYKHKHNISSDLEQITKTLENITNDWKERESSLQFIGRILKGNQGHSDFFINYFNNKLATYIEIQLSDLRSTVMKEACRITSLSARELGLAIEPGIIQLLTQNCLFKIAGSANQVISESASKCILNLLRYVKSIKVISNICEIKTMKANSVRILCAQSLVNIMCFYDIGLIEKAKNILEETMELLLVDANAEVRSTTRTSFILFKDMFELEAKNIFNKLGKNVQKQILEDEKNFDKSKTKIRINEYKKTSKMDDNSDNKVADYKELLLNKPKTPEFNNVYKKKSSKEFSKRKKKDRIISSERGRKSEKRKDSNYSLNKERKEETVKYINVDDDDIVENESEEDKKAQDDSRDVNMVFNYNISLGKNKNSHKLSFNKKIPSKISEDFNNTKTNNNEANQKNNKKENEKNKIVQTQNVNPFLIVNDNENDNKKNYNELIINQDKNNENNNTNNIQKISKAVSNLTTGNIINSEQNRKTIVKMSRIDEKVNQKNFENTEISRHSNLDKKSRILKKFNTKFDKLNAIKNFNDIMKNANKTNNLKEKENKTKDKSGEKIKVISHETTKKKNIQINPMKKSISNLTSKNSKTIEFNTIKTNSVNIIDTENDKNNLIKKNENKKKEKIEIVNIVLDEGENDLEEDINEAISINKNKDKTKKYNAKTMDKSKNKGNKNQNKYNINKKVIKKNKDHLADKSKDKIERKNFNLEKKLENNNLQDLYNELSNTKSIENNEKEEQIINGETLEQKVILILDKLDNLINQSEKLILFQYLFNYFNKIRTEIKTFSQSTIKRYIDIHIENLKENDDNLVEQILKNLMRMFFYLNDIFTTYDTQLILKILLFSLNGSNTKNLKNLSNDLLEIIKKKCDNEELFQNVYSLLSEYNTNYDDCYDFMYLLIPSCDNILKNINYFKQVFRLICLTDVSSKKVGKIIDILYRNYRDNFNQAFKEETQNNKQQILMFMEKLNSLYFREFKSSFENNLINSRNNSNEIDSNKIGHNQINSNIIKPNLKNIGIIKPTESGNISFSKDTSNTKNSETNVNSANSNNQKEGNNKNNNIIFNQNNKNNNNDINTINTNLNGNNIISINNSHNNNIIITNKLPDDIIPTEIKSAIKNNDLDQYISYIQKHKSYIPEFVLLLSNKKYSEQKYILTLLNFTKSILQNAEFSIDLNTCINLLIKQMIYIYNSNKNNQKIKEIVNNILSEMPIYLNSEKCLSSMDKYLSSDSDVSSLEIIILSLENFAKNYKQKVEGINKEIKPLKNLLDNFIFEIFNLLKHQNSEIRKRALYCCLEIYTVLGKEFEPLVEKLPNAQQNLIRLYMKKRIG